MAGPLAGALIGTAIGSTVGPLISAEMAPFQRTQQKDANRRYPNVQPPVELLFRAWHAGLLPEDVIRYHLNAQGVAWNIRGPTENPLGDAWGQLGKLFSVAPDVSFIMSAYARSLIGTQEATQGIIRAGADPERWLPYLGSFYAVPSVGVLMEARTRELVTDEYFFEGLRRLGFARGDDRRVIDLLREQIPPISDLIRFQVREVFSPELGNRLGIYDEFPAAIEPWFKKLGYTTDFGIPVQSDGAQRSLTTVLAEWAAHWQPISPSQGYEMLHRLRPGRINRYIEQLQTLTGERPNLQAFTMDDLRFWLRVSDYPKGIRDYLAAIAFAPLRLVDIRNALILNQRIERNPELGRRIGGQAFATFSGTDRSWAVEQFLDRGMAPDDAEVSADLAIANARAETDAPLRAIERASAGIAIKDIIDSYRMGITERAAAAERLTATSLEPRVVDIVLNHADLERQKDVIRSGVRRVRSEFLRGLMNEPAANRNLRQLGLTESRRQELISSWRLDSTPGVRRATTAQLLHWAELGLISADDLRTNLQDLGWTQPSEASLLGEARGRIAKTQAGILAAADRNRARAARELERLAGQVARQQREIRDELRRLTPVATLQRWLKKGIINEVYFRRRLAAMGYPPDIIIRYEEATRNGRAETLPAPAEEEPSAPAEP